jgi:hypothetical protein
MDQPSPQLFCKACGSVIMHNISLPSSPTPHLHRTFQAPNVLEAISIREAVSHTKLQLPQLNDAIKQIQAVLDELRQKRKALYQFTTEHETFLAPIRRLPSEILAHVFTLCLPQPNMSTSGKLKFP